MSTTYDLICMDCNETANVSASYDPIHIEEIHLLMSVASLIKSNVAPVDIKQIGLELRISEGFNGAHISLRWLVKHAGHCLRARSEYGEVENTCSKDIKCRHCNASHGYCDKDIGHQGECGKR